MDKVSNIKEKMDKRDEKLKADFKAISDQLEKIDELLDRDISNLNKESLKFYFLQVFNEMHVLEELDRKKTKDYNEAYHKNKKPFFEEMFEDLQKAIEEEKRENDKSGS